MRQSIRENILLKSPYFPLELLRIDPPPTQEEITEVLGGQPTDSSQNRKVSRNLGHSIARLMDIEQQFINAENHWIEAIRKREQEHPTNG